MKEPGTEDPGSGETRGENWADKETVFLWDRHGLGTGAARAKEYRSAVNGRRHNRGKAPGGETAQKTRHDRGAGQARQNVMVARLPASPGPRQPIFGRPRGPASTGSPPPLAHTALRALPPAWSCFHD